MFGTQPVSNPEASAGQNQNQIRGERKKQ